MIARNVQPRDNLLASALDKGSEHRLTLEELQASAVHVAGAGLVDSGCALIVDDPPQTDAVEVFEKGFKH